VGSVIVTICQTYSIKVV